MGDSQYSFSLTTFSPSGKLVQIEHALTAVGSGQTSLGIKAANGVVIATEKKLPSILVDEASVQKIQLLTPNIGVVYSGMGPDSRVLVRKSRKQAEQYYKLYKEPIPVTQLVRETAAVMQEFTQSGGVRPFGVSLLIAGFDESGPQLYQVDPSGSYFSWKASAMGKNVSNAKTFLEKRNRYAARSTGREVMRVLLPQISHILKVPIAAVLREHGSDPSLASGRLRSSGSLQRLR
uniref:Proteasome subunit alpha type n=1 Tax=Chenopodium quinoa TaxID=63459 RepID=A0A803NA83_CHEQI